MSKKKKQNPDINFLVQYFRDCCINKETATFVEMAKLISGDPQTSDRWKVTKAISLVQSEYGYIMQSVNSIGYRLVDSNTSRYCADRRIGKVRSQLRIGRKELDDSTKGKPVTMEDCIAYSRIAFVEMAAEATTQKAIEKVSVGITIDWKSQNDKTMELLMSIRS
jgi:hypothetical protein